MRAAANGDQNLVGRRSIVWPSYPAEVGELTVAVDQPKTPLGPPYFLIGLVSISED